MQIRYKLAALKAPVPGLATSYIGQIIHNETLDTKAMAEEYAKRYRVTPSTALFTLSSVAEFIATEVAEGRRLNFDNFSVGLKMAGRFSKANGIYSHDENPIRVVMTPKKSLHAVTRALDPVCETNRTKPWIDSIGHQRVSGESFARLDVMCLDGGLTTMNAYHCKVNKSADDEGVWLTSADGSALLLKAEIKENTEATCDVVFPVSGLLPGTYRIEIRSRGKPTNPLVVASRKVEVLPV